MGPCRGTSTGKGGLQGKNRVKDAGVGRVAGRGGEGRVGGRQSRLFQLDISNVEAAHVLIGALESPGDVLVHRAVIKVQALQGTD